MTAATRPALRPVDMVLSKLDGVRPAGRGWIARCPAHDDRRPSLSIAEGAGGRVLMRCFAGCSTGAVLRAIGLTWRDIGPADAARSARSRPGDREGPSPAGAWRRFRELRRRLRVKLAHEIRETERTLRRAGARILEDDNLAERARRLAWLEYVFGLLFDADTPRLHLEAVVAAARAVKHHDDQ